MALIGQRIEALREGKGLTQGQLAVYAKIAGSTVSLIESGARPNPGAEVLKKLAIILGTTVDYLVGLTDDPAPPPSDWTALPLALRPLVRQLAALEPQLQGRVAETFATILAELERMWQVPGQARRKPTLEDEIAEVVAIYPDMEPLFERALAELPEHAVRALLLNVEIWTEEARGKRNSFGNLHNQLSCFLK